MLNKPFSGLTVDHLHTPRMRCTSFAQMSAKRHMEIAVHYNIPLLYYSGLYYPDKPWSLVSEHHRRPRSRNPDCMYLHPSSAHH